MVGGVSAGIESLNPNLRDRARRGGLIAPNIEETVIRDASGEVIRHTLVMRPHGEPLEDLERLMAEAKPCDPETSSRNKPERA